MKLSMSIHRLKRRALLAGVFAAAVLAFAPALVAQDTAAKKRTIAVIPKGTTHEFWKSVHAGAVKAASEAEGVEVVWQGPLKEDDRNGQQDVVRAHVTKKTDAIVLAPLDSRALRAPVIAANKAKIPVVIIDSEIQREGVELVSFVATDNEKGGELAGEELARLIGGKGNVVLLRYAVGSASTEAREKGFLTAMARHPEIKLVSDNQYAGATAEEALSKAGSLLTSLKDQQVDGIFCPNESSTFGMLRALQAKGLAGKVKFVGFDASAKLIEALKAGEINALSVQNPFNMGYEGVKAAIAALDGKPVEPRIDTGVTLVTGENIETQEVKDLINPPLDKYLK